MSLPRSPMIQFESRQKEMATIGYYLKEGEFGDQFFVSDNGNRIDAEDVLLANWSNWRILFNRAKAQA